MPARVLGGVDRLLEPVDAQRRQLLGHDDSGLDVEAAMAVYQEGHVRPDGVPDRRGAPYAGTGQPDGFVGAALRTYLVEGGALHGAKAPAHGALGGRGEVGRGARRREQAAVDVGVQRDAVTLLAAQRLRQADPALHGLDDRYAGAQSAQRGSQRKVPPQPALVQAQHGGDIGLRCYGGTLQGGCGIGYEPHHLAGIIARGQLHVRRHARCVVYTRERPLRTFRRDDGGELDAG